MSVPFQRRLIAKGAKLPTQFHSYDSTADWFSKHERGNPRNLGDGEVPYKGISLRALAHPIEEGLILGECVSVPEYMLVTPALANEHFTVRLAGRRYEIVYADEFVQLVDSSIIPYLGGRIAVRSMSDLEGGPGRSAAGVLKSFLVKEVTVKSVADAACRVVSSAFTPYARMIAGKYGAEASTPGLIFQKYVANNFHHAIFNTAVKGQVRGYASVMQAGNDGLDDKTRITAFSQELGKPEPIGEFMHGCPQDAELATQFINAIHEFALFYSNEGELPVELEVAMGIGDGKIFLLQHRFIEPLSLLDLPDGCLAGKRQLATIPSAVGSGWFETNWVVFAINAHPMNVKGCLSLFLLDRMFAEKGIEYVIFSDSRLLDSGIGDDTRCLYPNARAVFDYGYESHGVFGPADMHFKRVNADLRTLYLPGDFVDAYDLHAFYSNPHLGTRLMPSFAHWDDSCSSKIPRDVASFANSFISGLAAEGIRDVKSITLSGSSVSALHLAEPLLIFADEAYGRSGRGGIYVPESLVRMPV